MHIFFLLPIQFGDYFIQLTVQVRRLHIAISIKIVISCITDELHRLQLSGEHNSDILLHVVVVCELHVDVPQHDHCNHNAKKLQGQKWLFSSTNATLSFLK